MPQPRGEEVDHGLTKGLKNSNADVNAADGCYIVFANLVGNGVGWAHRYGSEYRKSL
jgi:hypothetical protein